MCEIISTFCDKCGHEWIIWDNEINKGCSYCHNQLQITPREYLLEDTTILDPSKEQEFYDKYVKSSPNFSQWHFDNRNNYDKARWEEYDRDQAKIAKAKQEREEKEKRKHPTVTCPYCKSTNTHKIGTISKAIDVGLFGIFALPKVGKQYRCADCHSEF